jgi:small GTP-binding protein
MTGLPRTEKPRLKIILVGASGVGKTCLISSFFKKPFDPSVMSTVSPAYLLQEVTRRDGMSLCLQIWDTAGQERYHAVSQLFFREADVAFVCYEAGNEDSMEAVPDWVARVRKEVPDCIFVFVATKSDLLPPDAQAKVTVDAEKMFGSYQPKGYYLTSALNGDGVEQLFSDAAELFIPKQKAKRQPRDVQEAAPTKGTGGCCW